jgi:hypothetical protein
MQGNSTRRDQSLAALALLAPRFILNSAF